MNSHFLETSKAFFAPNTGKDVSSLFRTSVDPLGLPWVLSSMVTSCARYKT